MTGDITRRAMLAGTGKAALVATTVPAVMVASPAAATTGEISAQFAALARTFDQFATLALRYDRGGPADLLLSELQTYYLDRTNIAHDAIYEMWREVYVRSAYRDGMLKRRVLS